MFERFDKVARRVLFFARYEASELGSQTIAPEHILLGIVREEKGRAWEVLSKGKLSAEALSEAIKSRVVPGEGVCSIELLLNRQAKSVLWFAIWEADVLAHEAVGAEEMLVGLLREQGSVAEEVLAQAGLRLDGVRESLAGG